MTPTTRRVVVGKVIESRAGVSERAVCEALGWARTSMRYQCKKPARHAAIEPLLEIALAQPAWGYRRVLEEVRARGVKVGRRYFHKLHKEHGLAHRRRKAPRRARPTPAKRPIQAAHPHDIWAIDFMSDQLVNRQRIRILVVIDEFTRELVALRAARSFTASDVVRVLDEVRREAGRAPKRLRSDNGPEFIADELGTWRQATSKVSSVGPESRSTMPSAKATTDASGRSSSTRPCSTPCPTWQRRPSTSGSTSTNNADTRPSTT